jgi:tripartite-type tricarboxylate transporter receptor subunit TctC
MEVSMTSSIQTAKRVRYVLGAIAMPAFAAANAILIAAGAASAQAYPDKPIRLVLPLAAGSPIDAMARLTATALSARLGQSVIVENRPGGGGTLGTREAVRAAPDGYTLLFVGLNHVFAPSMAKNLDYDPVKDFAPIATVGTGSYTLVVAPSVPARSVKELAAYAKANPGKLNWGFGTATGPHLFGEIFLAATGMNVSRISYKSGPQAIPDMLGGRIHMNFGPTVNFLPLIQDGRLRALAVSSATRDRDLPDVPTMNETGLPQMTRGFWSGLLAPAGTPAAIVNRLNAEVNAVLATPEMKASLAKLGFEPKPGSPQDFAAMLRDEIATWSAAAKAAGIVPK